MSSKAVAVVLLEDFYECLEFHYPKLRLIEAGFDVKVVAPKKECEYKSKEGYIEKSQYEFNDIDPKEVQILIVPGGYAPDKLRRYKECLDLVKQSYDNGAIIGHICHGGWVPISANILKGKKTTCHFSIKDDIINSGAIYTEEKFVYDDRIVSAQSPKELPEFMKIILSEHQKHFGN